MRWYKSTLDFKALNFKVTCSWLKLKNYLVWDCTGHVNLPIYTHPWSVEKNNKTMIHIRNCLMSPESCNNNKKVNELSTVVGFTTKCGSSSWYKRCARATSVGHVTHCNPHQPVTKTAEKNNSCSCLTQDFCLVTAKRPITVNLLPMQLEISFHIEINSKREREKERIMSPYISSKAQSRLCHFR